MEGIGKPHTAKSVMAAGHKDIKTIDEAARLIVDAFVSVDEYQERISFKLGPFSFEAGEICRNFVQGRHLAVLQQIIGNQYLSQVLQGRELLIIGIDEADKCPVPLAGLIRAIVTHAQLQGVRKLRFAAAGVNPFFEKMVTEDSGIARFFYKMITLEPMQADEARDLLTVKLSRVVTEAEKQKIPLHIHPQVVERLLALAGGHPHLLQLLGSHLVEHENEDPDGIIDSRDLAGSLKAICYEDRAYVYSSLLHDLEIYDVDDALSTLLSYASPGFPTRIPRSIVMDVKPESLKWLFDHNIIRDAPDGEYCLVDEFLRVRLIFDAAESEAHRTEVEDRIVRGRRAVPGVSEDVSDSETTW